MGAEQDGPYSWTSRCLSAAREPTASTESHARERAECGERSINQPPRCGHQKARPSFGSRNNAKLHAAPPTSVHFEIPKTLMKQFELATIESNEGDTLMPYASARNKAHQAHVNCAQACVSHGPLIELRSEKRGQVPRPGCIAHNGCFHARGTACSSVG